MTATASLRSFVITPKPPVWEGWTVTNPGPALPAAGPGGFWRIELAPCGRAESLVTGETFRKRALAAGANSGMATRDLLLANASQIPAEYRGNVLVLAGAELEGPNGLRCLPCLWYGGGQWWAGAVYVNGDFDDHSLAVRVVPD